MEKAFEHFGYFKEFYQNNKFIGCIICEKDREIMGYYGRTTELIEKNIILDNGKTLKSGKYTTQIYILCGKRL